MQEDVYVGKERDHFGREKNEFKFRLFFDMDQLNQQIALANEKEQRIKREIAQREEKMGKLWNILQKGSLKTQKEAWESDLSKAQAEQKQNSEKRERYNKLSPQVHEIISIMNEVNDPEWRLIQQTMTVSHILDTVGEKLQAIEENSKLTEEENALAQERKSLTEATQKAKENYKEKRRELGFLF